MKNSEPKARRGEVQREKILAAATELFAHQGYKGTGIIAIAKSVGLDHSTVIYHFGTKEKLLLAVMDRWDTMHAEAMANYSGLGLVGFLQRYRAGESLMEPAVLTRLMAVLRAENLNPSDPLYEVLAARDEAMRAFAAGEIRSGQERGEWRSDVDPDVKATEIVAFFIGLEMLWLRDKQAMDLPAVLSSFLRTVIDDLARPDAPRTA